MLEFDILSNSLVIIGDIIILHYENEVRDVAGIIAAFTAVVAAVVVLVFIFVFLVVVVVVVVVVVDDDEVPKPESSTTIDL